MKKTIFPSTRLNNTNLAFECYLYIFKAMFVHGPTIKALPDALETCFAIEKMYLLHIFVYLFIVFPSIYLEKISQRNQQKIPFKKSIQKTAKQFR